MSYLQAVSLRRAGRRTASVFGDTANGVEGVSLSVLVRYPNNKGMLWEQKGVSSFSLLLGDLTKGWNQSSSVSAVTLRKSEAAVNHPGSSVFWSGTPLVVTVVSEVLISPRVVDVMLARMFTFTGSGEPKQGQEGSEVTGELQSNLCPQSEPQGIHLILLVWKVEAFLHSLRTWTWTYNLTRFIVSFIYNEVLCLCVCVLVGSMRDCWEV